MKLNRFSRRNDRKRQSLIQSANRAQPLMESLEDRQMMSLTVDIRVAGSSTPKVASVTSVGQVIYLQEWATITGSTSGSNDGIQSVTGSVLGTKTASGGVNGNLAAYVIPTFKGSGYQNGTIQDLNGDGNLDVGSNDNSQEAGFINARAGGLVTTGGTISGNSVSFVVATLSYTVTSLNYGQETDINFRFRNGVPAGAFDAVWLQDGNGQNDQVGTVGVGAPVVITDPNITPPVSGTISGTVTKSVSGSSSAFGGVTVYLDSNDNGTLDSGEPSTTTDSSGAYSFSSLSAGTYYLREVVPSGYSQTAPTSAPTTITISSGASTFTQNFTDTAAVIKNASISGTVSKVVSGTTSAFSGVTVYLDANNNGSLDSGETSTTTSSTGSYSFSGLAAGTYYVREVVPSGYSQTSPSSSPTTLVLSAGQASTGDNFTDTAASSTGTGSLLKGTVIGTAGSWQNDGLTIKNAFDGNLSTYFIGPTANGDWAGLNLGSTYKITKVSYSPQPGWTSRMVGGIFQGSTSPTFASGNVTLATITSAPSAGVYTSLNVTNTTPFEYVRYLGPNGSYGDVAELQFYGTTASSGGGGGGTTYSRLTGTTIGTAGSYQNDGLTIAKATDGNLSTEFIGPTANGNWVGYDLGSSKTISQIKYAPQSGWTSRLVGGQIQVSTTANFSSGVTTIYTITSAPPAGSLTTVTLSSPATARYVRYLSPNGSYGDIAEFEVFG